MSTPNTAHVVDEFLRRNAEFADRHDVAALPPMPSSRAIILGCGDPRVDPAVILGLQLGEAVVIRNIGGRVTPGVLRTLGLLALIARSYGVEPGPGLHLIVLHHTDCGIAHLADHRNALADELGTSPDALDQQTLANPRASLAFDLAALRTNPSLPRGLIVVPPSALGAP